MLKYFSLQQNIQNPPHETTPIPLWILLYYFIQTSSLFCGKGAVWCRPCMCMTIFATENGSWKGTLEFSVSLELQPLTDSLILFSTTMANMGAYKCKAENAKGSDETQGKITIKPVSNTLTHMISSKCIYASHFLAIFDAIKLYQLLCSRYGVIWECSYNL